MYNFANLQQGLKRLFNEHSYKENGQINVKAAKRKQSLLESEFEPSLVICFGAKWQASPAHPPSQIQPPTNHKECPSLSNCQRIINLKIIVTIEK